LDGQKPNRCFVLTAMNAASKKYECMWNDKKLIANVA